MIMIKNQTPTGEPAEKPLYEVGQLIQHRRYGYRGVIVHLDLFCKAPDEWYYQNKTQPKRDQPWYHVLVDGSSAVTYAAQTSIMQDETEAPIDHPLLEQFFEGYTNGKYLRNNHPWT